MPFTQRCGRPLSQWKSFSNDEFIQRALAEQEPEAGVRKQAWSRCVDSAAAVLPNIPEALQDTVASAVSLVKVEAKFNPNKVGDTVKCGCN